MTFNEPLLQFHSPRLFREYELTMGLMVEIRENISDKYLAGQTVLG